MPTKLPILFYREFGTRRLNELLSPKIINILDLPRQSTYHYCTFDPDACDIDTSLTLLNVTAAQRIFVDYVQFLKSEEGTPRRVAYQLLTNVRPFHRENRKFKRQEEAAVVNTNEKILNVLNYNYIQKFYRYVENKWSDYNSWKNLAKTVFINANELCERSSFAHYIEFKVPLDVPSRGLLVAATNNFSTSMLGIFNTEAKRMVFELWKWFDPEQRHNSIFNEIEEKNLSRINLIFRAENGKTALINMGYLYSWIDGNPNLTPIKSLNTKRWMEVRKAMLYFFIILGGALDLLNDSEVLALDTDDQNSLRTVTAPDDDLSMDDLDEQADKAPNPLLSPVSTIQNVNVQPVNLDDDSDIDFSLDREKRNLDDIDKILDEMERISKAKLKKKGIKIEPTGIVEELIPEKEMDIPEIEDMVFKWDENIELLQSKINTEAEFGVLTAADMRKLSKDIEAYKAMPDPYGSGKTIIDAKIVKPEEVKIDEVKSTIKTSDIVPDESMKKSSLISFTEDYVTNVIQKDMLSMVDALQRGGVVIRDYQVKTEYNELGDYEVHSLELKPIGGAASTIHFKLPKVSKDGTFKNNGNKYVARIQRADVPIRKISPSEVALSSYYGKTFVSLDDRKANSERDYLIRKIGELSLSEGSKVSKIAPANVFDNLFEAPYIYSVMSTAYRLIVASGHLLDFDHTSRDAFVQEDSLAKYEKSGAVVCGLSSGKNPIIIDNDNVFWEVTPIAKNRLGDIFDLTGIDKIQAPVEYAFVKVYAKEIPVGVYLSYFIGFSNLLKLLRVKYRVVAPRKQKELTPDEYAISFMDGSYIFDRKDRKAALILGGFTILEKPLKRIEVADLDSKDVYLTLLAGKGITTVHLKEMDCTQDYFIDPITLEVLREMKEPTTFNGLLIRATELLLTYYHPKTQDLQYMRFRGYERMAGYAYSCMVNAIRSFKGKNISGKSKIDLPPFEVWNSFMKDESIKLVEDTNPIQNLKEKEVVTYTGAGGRSKDSMPMGMRAYDKSDIGVISEANVDSGDAGINTYLAPNPEFANLRGMVTKRDPNRKDIMNSGSSSILSTSGLLAPLTYKDD